MSKEIKYYGIHACLELAAKRPGDIIRVYVDPSNVKTFKTVLKWCADHRKAYHIIPTDELAKVSDSVHHEGVCILAKERPLLSDDILLKNLPQKGCLIYLDGVENPNNFGSILRTAAHFGVAYILGEHLPITPSACRIAKGGVEIVNLVALKRPFETLATLEKRGFVLISTSSRSGKSLYQFTFPPRSIIAIGAESTGLTGHLLKKATHSIRIPGTDAVESLNVAVASGLCMGEYCRQHGS
jgi:TrmH RNA methyltransferase